MYNVAIVGAGPAGIFAALEITKLKPDWKVILIEKGYEDHQLHPQCSVDVSSAVWDTWLCMTHRTPPG